MYFDTHRLPSILYVIASVLIGLSFFVGVATITQHGQSDGRIDWILGLVFISIPFIVYNALTPHYSRATRFSNPYAHASVDSILIILWLTAWASVANYVATGKGRGTAATSRAQGCHNFSHGTPTKCNLATANCIFGVIIMLTFVGTAYFSFRNVFEYAQTGRYEHAGIAFPARQASFGRAEGKEQLRGTSRRLPDEDEEVFDARTDNIRPYQGYGQVDERTGSFEQVRLSTTQVPQGYDEYRAGGRGAQGYTNV